MEEQGVSTDTGGAFLRGMTVPSAKTRHNLAKPGERILNLLTYPVTRTSHSWHIVKMFLLGYNSNKMKKILMSVI